MLGLPDFGIGGDPGRRAYSRIPQPFKRSVFGLRRSLAPRRAGITQDLKTFSSTKGPEFLDARQGPLQAGGVIDLRTHARFGSKALARSAQQTPATTPSATIAFADKVAFLARPEAYAHRPREVTCKQTHMSWVFLAGDKVYKLKKPFDFPISIIRR